MKKIYTLLCCCLSALLSQAQLNHTIDFNTYVSGSNNDLENNFTNNSHLNQVISSGITGGAVSAGPSAHYNPATYKKVLKLTTSPTNVSICFKFNKPAFQASSSDDGVDLSFVNADGASGGFSFTGRGDKIEVSSTASGFSSSYTGGSTLSDGHWYQLRGTVAVSPTQSSHLITSIYIYDLGTSGTASPTLVTSRVGDLLTTASLTNNLVKLTLNGSVQGGADYMDNFNITGQEALGITPQQLASEVTVPSSIGASGLPLSSSLGRQVAYFLYDGGGACVSKGTFVKDINIDCSALPAGIYFIRLNAENSILTRKLVKI